MLQFWVPQTPEFEQALLSTMRLPTVLGVMDGDAERVSLKILNALSTFENIGNLPAETTTRVLLNDALRQKLRVEDDVAKQVELVREALIEENKKAEQRLNEERLRASQLQQHGEKLEVQLASAASEMQKLRADLEEQRTAAADSRAAVQKTEERLAAYIEEGERRRARQKFVSLWLVVLLVTTTAILYSLIRLGARSQAMGITLGALTLFWLLLVDHAGRRLKAISEWKPFEAFRRFRTWVYGTLLAGALASAAWDGAKSLWSGNPESARPNATQTLPQSK